ncbi:MAG: hypothetical protein GY906_37580 [bacterium]|nr:hypothetical protein [bacterium]
MVDNRSCRIGGGLYVTFVALLFLAIPAGQVAAQSAFDSVQIHGFGGWAYGETDGNAYLVGTEDGRYDNADFALNVTAQPMENLSIVAQLRGEAVRGEDQFELDYAFAAYDFADSFNARIGRVKHPFGIYGEIYDVGTLRPFYNLPQAIYGPNGYTARAYNGVGVAGWFDWGADWGLQYDVYLGEIEGDFVTPGITTTDPNLFLEPRVNFGFRVSQTIGFRAKVTTPVDGLTFGLSGFTGDDETELDVGLEADASRDVLLGSVEYLTHRWSVRAEYGTLKRDIDFESESWYLEAAFRLTEHWQLAVRKDQANVTLPSTDFSTLPPFFPQLLDHEELALGVNYWFGSNLVIRLSYQMVEGNRFAFLETPEQVGEMLITGDLEYETNLIVFGAQFSF